MDRRHRSRYRPQLDVLEDRLSPGSLGHTGIFDPGHRHDPLAAVGQAGALLDLSPSAPQGAQANPDVFPVNSRPFGMTYGQWSAAWWQWATSLPADQHPLFDTADCSAGQSGHVWFLGGTFVVSETATQDFVGVADRSCTVPTGTALFFPILNAEASTAEGNGTTEAKLRASAQAAVDGTTSLQATIDGRPIENLASYRVQSPLFTYGPVPDNNIFQALGENVPAGTTSLSAADGYYVMLRPLSAGQHTIHFSASAVIGQKPDGSPATFTLDITYHLHVVPHHAA